MAMLHCAPSVLIRTGRTMAHSVERHGGYLLMRDGSELPYCSAMILRKSAARWSVRLVHHICGAVASDSSALGMSPNNLRLPLSSTVHG
jgi:hypothetical protein